MSIIQPIESGAEINVTEGTAVLWSWWHDEEFKRARLDEYEESVLESAKARHLTWVREDLRAVADPPNKRTRVESHYRGFVVHPKESFNSFQLCLPPPAAANPLPIPGEVSVTTGNDASRGKDADGFPINESSALMEGVLQPNGTYRWRAASMLYAPCSPLPGPDHALHPVIVTEEISVKWQKRDELDAAMLRECRAALAKLREWPRCAEGDHAMKIACACRTTAGEVAVYVGCEHASMMVGVHALADSTHRMLGDSRKWTALEFRK